MKLDPFGGSIDAYNIKEPEKSKPGGGSVLGNSPRREMQIRAQSSIQTQQLFWSVQPHQPT
jgi:hypothetical protein